VRKRRKKLDEAQPGESNKREITAVEKEKILDEARAQNINKKEKAADGDKVVDGDKLSTLSSDEQFIAIICDNLGELATLWAEVRSEAIHFANQLDAGLQVTTTPAFRLLLRNARETAVVLVEGLRIYARGLSG